jgi:hypothetical protein
MNVGVPLFLGAFDRKELLSLFSFIICKHLAFPSRRPCQNPVGKTDGKALGTFNAKVPSTFPRLALLHDPYMRRW